MTHSRRPGLAAARILILCLVLGALAAALAQRELSTSTQNIPGSSGQPWDRLPPEQQTTAIASTIDMQIRADSLNAQFPVFSALFHRYGMNRASVPPQVKESLARYLMDTARGKGPKQPPGPRPCGNDRPGEFQINIAMSLTDIQSTTAQEAVALLATDYPNPYFGRVRDQALDFLAKAGRQDLLLRIGTRLPNCTAPADRDIAARALMKLKDLPADALSHLEDEITTPSGISVCHLWIVVTEMPHGPARTRLAFLLVRTHPDQAKEALEAVVEEPPQLLNPYTAQLEQLLRESPREELRTLALQALTRMGRKVSSEELVAIMQDTKDRASRQRIQSLLYGRGVYPRPSEQLISCATQRALTFARDNTSSYAARLFEGHRRQVVDVTFSPDGTRLASLAEDGLRIWSPTAAGPLLHIPTEFQDVNADKVTFSPSGEAVVACYPSGRHIAWSVQTGTQLASFADGPFDGKTRIQLQFAGNNLLSATQDGTVSVWRFDSETRGGLTTPTLANKLTLPRKNGTDHITLSPDGDILASVGMGDGIQIFRWQRPTPPIKLPCSQWGPLAFSPKGDSLVMANSGKLFLQDVATGTLKGQADVPAGSDEVIGASYCSGGKLIAAASAAGTIYLLESSTGRLVDKIPAHKGISVIAASKDAKWLATGGDDFDATVRVWRVP